MDKVEKAKQVSEFAKKVIALVEEAPDGLARRDLNRMIHYMRQRYLVSPEKKKSEILTKITDGARSFAELMNETGYSKHQLARGLEMLKTEQLIREEKVRRSRGAGRPQICYFPV